MTHYEIPANPSPQVKAVLNYLDSIKVFNLPKIEKLFTDDFVQSTLPLSLGIPSRTKAEDLAFLRGFADQLGGRPLEVIHSYPRLPCPGCTSDNVVDRLQSTTLWSHQGRLGPMYVNFSS